MSNSELSIIQEYLGSNSGKVLLCTNDSDMINSFSNGNFQVLTTTNKVFSDHIDNLILTKSFHKELLKYDQKFDTIIIHDLFEQIKYPEVFLQNLVSILSDKGTIICSISNFFHITNIFNILVGKISHNEFFNVSKFYNLDRFLLFLNENDMHVTKVSRIKKDFSSDKLNLDDSLIPCKLIDMIQKITDYDTLQYVLVIAKGKTISSENLEFVTQFPKNYLLSKLQEYFEKFSELESSVLDKDKLIEGYEKSIKEQKTFTASALSDKDKLIEGYEKSIKEQKTFTESALSDKDKLIEGYEKSIKELLEYIENLEQTIKNKDHT